MERPKSLLERIQEALTLTPGISLTSGTPKAPLPPEFTPPAQETPSLVDRALPKVYDPLQQQQQDIAKLAVGMSPAGTADDFNKAVQDKDPWGLTLAGAGIIPGGGLLSGARKLPKLWSGYHGTKVRENFTKFKMGTDDLGIHFTTDPRVARQYALGQFGGGLTLTGHERTIPVVADIRSPVKFPADPIMWSSMGKDYYSGQNSVLKTLEGVPGYEELYKDLSKLEGRPGGWDAHFIPEMQNRGYDAIRYPHYPEHRFAPQPNNAFMVFDPNQIHGKFTPEGQALIAERGARKPKSILTMEPGELATWQKKYNQQPILEKSKEEIYKKYGISSDTSLSDFFYQFPEFTVSPKGEIVKKKNYSPYTSGWGDKIDEPKGGYFDPNKNQEAIDELDAALREAESKMGAPGVQQHSISASPPGIKELLKAQESPLPGTTMTHPGYFKSPPEEIVKNVFPKASKDKLDELIKALTDWEKRQ